MADKDNKPTHWIVSTLSANMDYTTYGKGGGDLPVVAGVVHVAGGANIPDKFMRTPEGGVITGVTDEELSMLQENEVFRLHKQNGFIKILDSKPKSSEVAASDMEGRDQSAPLVDQDFPDHQQPKPNAPAENKNSRKA